MVLGSGTAVGSAVPWSETLVTRTKKLSRALNEEEAGQFAVAALEQEPPMPDSKPNRMIPPLLVRFGATPERVQSASDAKVKVTGLVVHCPLSGGRTEGMELLAR